MNTLQLCVPGDKGRLKKQRPAHHLSLAEHLSIQEMLRPKSSRPAETPVVEADPSPVIDITDAPKAPPPSEHLLFLGARVLDIQFVVADVPLAQIEAELSLPPHFSVIFQALYESFFSRTGRTLLGFL